MILHHCDVSDGQYTLCYSGCVNYDSVWDGRCMCDDDGSIHVHTLMSMLTIYIHTHPHTNIYTRTILYYSIATWEVEMQRYIDISSYRDTLGSDTVSIHI